MAVYRDFVYGARSHPESDTGFAIVRGGGF